MTLLLYEVFTSLIWRFCISCLVKTVLKTVNCLTVGGGGREYSLYREAPPDRGTFYRPRVVVYKWLGISPAKV